jgi:hypothetical protein
MQRRRSKHFRCPWKYPTGHQYIDHALKANLEQVLNKNSNSSACLVLHLRATQFRLDEELGGYCCNSPTSAHLKPSAEKFERQKTKRRAHGSCFPTDHWIRTSNMIREGSPHAFANSTMQMTLVNHSTCPRQLYSLIPQCLCGKNSQILEKD